MWPDEIKGILQDFTVKVDDAFLNECAIERSKVLDQERLTAELRRVEREAAEKLAAVKEAVVKLFGEKRTQDVKVLRKWNRSTDSENYEVQYGTGGLTTTIIVNETVDEFFVRGINEGFPLPMAFTAQELLEYLAWYDRTMLLKDRLNRL